MAKKLNSGEKALFIQRLGAFVIDIFIVYLLASLISISFVDNSKADEINDKSSELVEKYMNQDIEISEFTSEYINLYYKNATENGLVSLVYIVCLVLYFIVFQTYQNGQTFGKKLTKIRVVSDTGELTMNQMIFRSFLSTNLLVSLCSFVFMLFSTKYVYFYSATIIGLIYYTILFGSIFMVMFRKDGRAIHDMVVHTHVIKEN